LISKVESSYSKYQAKILEFVYFRMKKDIIRKEMKMEENKEKRNKKEYNEYE